MKDIDLARVPRTTTLTLLTDWPLSKPNRDLNGDQKAAIVGGVRRHVISSANRKFHWRKVWVPGSLLWLSQQEEALGGTYSMSTRTKYVANKLIALPLLEDEEVRERLSELGVGEETHRSKLVELGSMVFKLLQKTQRRGASDDADPSEEEAVKAAKNDMGDESDDAPDEPAAEVEEDRDRKSAIAAYGEREMEEIRAALKRHLVNAQSWDAAIAKSGKNRRGKGSAIELSKLLRYDEKMLKLWSLSRLERLGIDGALFGTMVTQDDYRIAAPSAVQVSHSITVHRAFDFETLEIAKDDLEDGPEAAMMLDASYASGLYATSVTIDHCQLLENVMAPEIREDRGKWVDRIGWKRWTDASEPDRELAAKLAHALVISVLYASDHAMKTQTNARVYPSYVLAETSTKGGLNLLGAFSEPINERRTNSILSTAIERLRAYTSDFDKAYGMTDQRAELIVSSQAHPKDAPSWRPHRPGNAEALASWVADRVGETRVA